MILLVIDTQKLITNETLSHFDLFRLNMKRLIEAARSHGIEVIYIRHDDGEGEALIKGTEGFEIYDEFKPLPGEKIYDKTVNSAFRDTGLTEYLIEMDEKDVIITGLQTDYCIDASVKCAFEHGFHVFVPAFANTTTDNAYMTGENSYRYYNEFMWNGRYAECIAVDDMIGRMAHDALIKKEQVNG